MTSGLNLTLQQLLFFKSSISMTKTIGIILFIISSISFLLIPVLPFLGLPGRQIAGITAVLIVVGEVLFYLSLLLLGRTFYEKIKSKLRFRRVKNVPPAPPQDSDPGQPESQITG